MLGWLPVLDEGVELIMWWQYLVKNSMRHLSKARCKEIKKQRTGQLNMLNFF